MPGLLLKSALLLVLAFVAGRGIGYLLAQRKSGDAATREPEIETQRLDTPAAPAANTAETTPEVAAATPKARTPKARGGVKAEMAAPVAGSVPEPVAEPEPLIEPVAAAPVFAPPRTPAKVKAVTRGRAEPGFRISPLAAMSVAEVEAEVEKAGAPAEPMRLKSADSGKPDPLLDIVGIGPVNEVQLHALGIYHFRQIAAWSPENIKWVAERIKFPTRIVRENWMKQAAEMEKAKRG